MATTRYLTVAGGRIAYDDAGSGPVVICIPGIGDIRDEYRFLAPQLMAAGYRVVTMDPRGQGETAARWSDYSVAAIGSDIVALARELNAGKVFVAGNSRAAGATVCAAAEAPEMFAGIILISAVVRDTMPKWRERLMYTFMVAPLFTGPWATSAWIAYLRTLYPTAKPADFDAYVERVRANMSEPGRMRALRDILSPAQESSGSRLSAVKTPTLIIMGTKDSDFPKPEAEAGIIARSLGGPSEVYVIEGAGHYPHAEMPETTAQPILGFLASQRQAVAHGA